MQTLIANITSLGKSDQLIGDRIRRLRKNKGLTQNQLAEAVGATDGSHVSKWENGNGISRDYLVKLADVFDTSPEYLETGSSDDHRGSHDSIEDLQQGYRSRKEKKGFSDTEKDLLLEVLLNDAESLAANLRRLIEIEKGRFDE